MSSHGKRIGWIDFGKGFTIFLVVIAHTFGGIYTNNIYSGNLNNVIKVFGESLFLFIMPVFFSLSGYLYKVRKDRSFSNYLTMVRKKAWNLLTPYVVFSFVYVLMNQIGGKSREYSWNSLFRIYAMPISHLWFLYILFFIFVLVGALSFLRISINVQLVLYLLAFIAVQLLKPQACIFNTFGWAVFFCLGMIFKQHEAMLKSKLLLYGSLALTVLSIVLMFLTLGVSHRYYNGVSLINIIPKAISDLFMISLCVNVSARTKFYSYFERYGKYSLIIYMVHAPLLSAARAIILKFGTFNELFLIIILILIGWYGSLAVVWLNNRYKPVRFVFNAYSTLHQKS
ncbi:acyltransferase family protein [Limosilactobacillus vaginalis]|uniref:acyltransferase family protein n=1 Tax=Limosilactobacillus vaginalis TaxID=1633 RepID=UPI0025A48BEA|nr:acyltransferase [Limosilactobacillus vaginalis]MDM8304423.1 acyltransferase [Limosilactobacillus vaginalis]